MADYDLLLGGDVWDAEGGHRADRWVAIDDGRIEGVHPTRPGSASETREVDVLVPGLIDTHVHLVWDGSADPVATLRAESEQELLVRAIENGRRQLEGGVTTVRDVGSVADIAITLARAVRSGRLRGPRVRASGRTVIITAGHDPFWGIEVDGVDACRSAVRTLRGKGADLIKVSATGGVYGQAVGERPGVAELSPAELSAIVEEAGRFDLPVAAHAVGREGIRNAIAAGVDTLEHGNRMDQETLEAAIERDVAYDPTLYVYREIANATDGVPSYARENAQRVFEDHWEIARTAIASDVRIIAGSDAGSPRTPHPSLHRELACLVEAGMDESEALRAATLTPARELGSEGLGRIEAGTPADLVGFAADPLERIEAVADPALVVRGGVVVSGR